MPIPGGSRIAGLGAYRPETQVTNDEISARCDLEPEWIAARTGIARRGHASAHETIATMAQSAGADAIADAGLTPEDFDLVILACSTARRPVPGIAPEVAALLEIPDCGAFDVNAVCAGFTYALSTASDAVRLGHARNVLVVGSERTSDWTGPPIPDSFAIFGDGAAAVVVAPSDEAEIGPPAWGSDGNRHAAIEIPADSELIHMNGNLVYKWAVTMMPASARLACKRADVAVEDVDWLVPHQANGRIVAAIGAELGIPADRVVCTIEETGNTSAASIPTALTTLRRQGRSSRGDRALLIGFGAGLTYAAQVVRMP